MKMFRPYLILRRAAQDLILPAGPRWRSLGPRRTRDVAFAYRMGAGFPGDVNRMHPASIEPALNDPQTPVGAYGVPVLVDATSQAVRPMVAGDQALTAVYGISVRPYPMQTRTGSDAAPFGSQTPPPGAIDVLRSGYIIASVVGSPVKGDTVYVWTSVSAGAHVQGGFEAVNPAGDGMHIADTKTTFNGSPDSSGLVEIAFNV